VCCLPIGVNGRLASHVVNVSPLAFEHGLFLDMQTFYKFSKREWFPVLLSRIVEIVTFASGQGLACPPLSTLRQVESCSVSSPTTPTCSACSNSVQDVNETDVDCGGTSTCTMCGEGKLCSSTADCAANLLCSVNNTCVCE
jgi:hypothetical protein